MEAEKRLHSRYILKVIPPGFADGFDTRYQTSYIHSLFSPPLMWHSLTCN